MGDKIIPHDLHLSNPGSPWPSPSHQKGRVKEGSRKRSNSLGANSPQSIRPLQNFEAHSLDRPDAIAMVQDDHHLTYRELNCRSHKLGSFLRQHGVTPEKIVGVSLTRSFDLVVSILGVIKAGGAVLPLEPSYPHYRIRMMLEEAKPCMILTTQDFRPFFESQGIPVMLPDAHETQTHSVITTPLSEDLKQGNLSVVFFTSGSSGRPKGVMEVHLEQGSFSIPENEVLTTAHPDLKFGVEDRVLVKCPISFAPSFWEIIDPLLGGGVLVLAGPGQEQDFPYLVNLIRDEHVTKMHFVPSVLQQFLEQPEVPRCRSLTQIICSGEFLQENVRQTFFDCLDVNLYFYYAATEAPGATILHLHRGNRDQPLAFESTSPTKVYVLNQWSEPDSDVQGEMYVEAKGKIRGYLGRPTLTAEKFVPDPLSSIPGARLYKTGDLGCYLPNGSIHVVGRRDYQVKIRGIRVELGEIESALRNIPSIRDAVVLCREDTPGEKHLVAYFIPKMGLSPEPLQIRTDLQSQLPSYMLPVAFVNLKAFPLTPTGKIDRRSLPVPSPKHRGHKPHYHPPHSSMEKILAQIWQNVLQVGKIGMYDNFFDLGGHSLLATKLLGRINQRFNTELTIHQFFTHPTIAELHPLLVVPPHMDQPPPLQSIPRKPNLPPSFAQERLWFLEQWSPASSVYNLPLVFRLRGSIQIQALEVALQALVARHETLRTTFPMLDGSPYQHIQNEAEAAKYTLSVVKLAEQALDNSEEELQRVITQETRQPFDLSQGPLMRAKLISIRDREAVFILTLHHIVTDGWSMNVLLNELSKLYAAQVFHVPVDLPKLPIQYADYSLWQRNKLQGKESNRQVDYWRSQLADAPHQLELPTDKLRPLDQSYQGATLSYVLPSTLLPKLSTFSQEQRTSQFMTLLTVFQVLLFRYSGQRDILVGTPIAGRSQLELESLIGFFVNTLVIRTRIIEKPTFLDVLQQVRETCLQAYSNQDLPFEKLVEALQPTRDPSRHPFFQVMFQLTHDEEKPPLHLPHVEVESMSAGTQTAKFDLSFALTLTPESLMGHFIFNTAIFEPSTIDRLATHYHNLLEQLLAHPDVPITGIPFLTDDERHQLLVEWNPPPISDQSFSCLHHLFEAQAFQTPDVIAVVNEGQHLTYGTLHRLANQLARTLQHYGVGPEVMVGIYSDKSLECIIGILAILKAGGAYVPLDPAMPIDRVSQMAHQANLPIILVADPSRAAHLTAPSARILHLTEILKSSIHQPTPNLDTSMAPSMMAYMIFTSGSTGSPKGTVVSHSNILNAYRAWDQQYRLRTHCPMHLQMANVSFDVFTGDLTRALGSSATLVLCSREVLLNPQDLYALIQATQIACAEFVPGVLKNLLNFLEEFNGNLHSFRLVIVGSDMLEVADFRRIKGLCNAETRVINSYGLTETTIDSSFFEEEHGNLPPLQSVPIGRPLPNIHMFALDQGQWPVPIGVTGEVFIGGDGLSRGYWERPALTAERFLPHPTGCEPGMRLYRTGDLARIHPDGNFHLVGRSDHQVKIRGFRVELGEIEAALRQYPTIQEALVVYRENEVSKEKQLAAYVVNTPHQDDFLPSLQKLLHERLPGYMIPTYIVPLDEFPRFSSGKVNRRALPIPEEIHDHSDPPTAPRTPVEELLVQVWAEVLSLPKVDVQDNFFNLGGHSLMATRLLSRLQKTFETDLPLRLLFDHPSLEDQALTIEEHLLEEFERMEEERHERKENTFEDG